MKNCSQCTDNQQVPKPVYFSHILGKHNLFNAPYMKGLVKFFRREWFLLAMVATITLIFLLFELL
jgi:hypothetical protein